MKAAIRGSLPDRYSCPLDYLFSERVGDAIRPGCRILDVGAGRTPSVRPEKRPTGVEYWGLDVSSRELELAPAGSYNAVVVRDVGQLDPELIDRFDLVLSFQVLEHVPSLPVALHNLYRYLKPGGRLIAQLSGAFTVFGIANRLLPHSSAEWVLHRFVGRDPETVFPAHYHRCWHSALNALLASWSAHEISPIYLGAAYFRSFAPAMALALGYEEWTRRRDHRNLAPYYLIDARR